MVQNTPRTSQNLSEIGQEKMTIDEFFQAVRETRPDKREDVANRLLRELDPDERILAESTIGDFISSLNGVQDDD